jgi:hypothetical protein
MKAVALLALACVAVVLVVSPGRLDVLGLFEDEPEGSNAPKLDATGPSGEIVFEDTGAREDPKELWGSIDCDTDDDPPAESGPIQVDTDGDPSPKADGSEQGDEAFRIVRVQDGDDYFGERCELGLNDHRTGPTTLYRDGEHWLTYFSFRLPPSFPIDTEDWQGVMQMKQTQPADNGRGTPVLSLGAYDGSWILFHSGPGYTEEDRELWSAPAQPGVWTRFRFDVVYSADPDKGRIAVSADLDGDGQTGEPGETSPTFTTNTLKVETEGHSDDGFLPGEALPSHLRIGLYHNPVIPCPSGCHLDVDNVQVARP